MGGFFGVASNGDCSLDLFFGVDYHSHLGTRRGGLAVFTEDGKFAFEVVIIDSVEATCITLNSNHGLKKGTKLIKKAKN